MLAYVLIVHILSDFDLNGHFVIAFVTWMALPCASNKSQARGVVGLPYVGMKFPLLPESLAARGRTSYVIYVKKQKIRELGASLLHSDPSCPFDGEPEGLG